MTARKGPFTVVKTKPEMAERLAEIQRACFPNMQPSDLITAEQFARHTAVFPEGQHAVVDADGTVVGSSCDIRHTPDFDHIEHKYMDISGNNWLTTHDRQGEWLYGIDIGIHPDWRGLKLSELLYDARKETAKKLNLKGHVACGMMKGYHTYKDKMSAVEYGQKLVKGELFDPVVSVQLRRGFRIHGIVMDYVDDPTCDNKAAFIVWDNPDYTAGK